MNVNSNPHPRTPHLRAVIKAYGKERQAQARMDVTADRGLDTEARFGSLEEFQKAVDVQLMADNLMAHRTPMDLLISQYMLLRSEDRRRAELCDLVGVDSLHEAGHQKNVKMLVLRLREGKVPSSTTISFC
jgi:hypothetical protein